jgi:hypothetical protein
MPAPAQKSAFYMGSGSDPGAPDSTARIVTTRGRIKGALFREFIRYCVLHYEQPLAPIASGLPTDLQPLVDPEAEAFGIIASMWYPAELPAHLLELFFSELPVEEHQKVLREGARYALERTLSSLHRATFRLFVNPERAARHVQRLWRLNCDTGNVTWRLVGKNRCESTLRGWASHDVRLCEIARLSAAHAFELMGCRDVHSERIACVAQGTGFCGSVITWS